jgi:hypothetical protein
MIPTPKVWTHLKILELILLHIPRLVGVYLNLNTFFLAQFPHHILILVMEFKNIKVVTTNQSVKNLMRDGYE